MLEVTVVLAIFGVVAAIALPVGPTAIRGYQLARQAHAIASQVSLAKMRAAALSTRARVYIDRVAGTYHLEVFNRTTSQWTTDGGVEQISRPIRFGFGGIEDPPPNTQGHIDQPDSCTNNAGASVGGTSCVMFNSRGVPIDSTGAATGGYGVYLNDRTAVYATTVSATGMTQLWWTPTQTTSWQRQ